MDTGTSEPRTLRLARYLKEFVGLRSTTVRDVSKYESVMWLADAPQEPECKSPAWNDDFEPGEPWLEVRKQQFPRPPAPPEIITPWIDVVALKRASIAPPPLQQTRLEPDGNAQEEDGEERPLVERHLGDFPEVISAYERFCPTWQSWSDEFRRREKIQGVYAELFALHNQIQKQGEILELVLGLGLLDWPGSSELKQISVKRHVVTARVDLRFDAASGIIRVEAAGDGAQLRIEDDMLEAEFRPERGHYASVDEQLKAIDDDIWDRPRMFRAIRSWAEALHPHAQWSSDLLPVAGTPDRPAVTFAPALILRKRTQVAMARVYETMIARLATCADKVPEGWANLVDDTDDRDRAEPSQTSDNTTTQLSAASSEIYFPLPANREQRRIVEAVERRRGVLVQGPPGTGKSHTIANLICHLLATGKRVLVTAETARALRVLKDKLPADIQPLCVSLLGQGGDSFAELNAAVQGITTRHAIWRPGLYDDRIIEIGRDLTERRALLASIDTELRSLRESETWPHSLVNGKYRGTASSIAKQVASEREQFGWLRVPLEAGDQPRVNSHQLLAWLRISRCHDADTIDRAKLRVLDSNLLPMPQDFSTAVVEEREANTTFLQLAALRNHVIYRWAAKLSVAERARIGHELDELNRRRKALLQHRFEWLPVALEELLAGRQARWQALLTESKKLLERIENRIEHLGASTVVVPPGRDPTRVRADAELLAAHLRAGGKLKFLRFMIPKVVRERSYLYEQVTIDGQPADTEERLLLACDYLDLNLAFNAMDKVWADFGGLPSGSQYKLRFAAISEQIQTLAEALSYCRRCLELGGGLPEPVPATDWLTSELEKWKDIVVATAIEDRCRVATERVTSCLGKLIAISELHDTHPTIHALLRAVEQRDAAAYGEAFGELRHIEQIRRDEDLRQGVEAALSSDVPGLLGEVTASIDDPIWDTRFQMWDKAWSWSIVDNWLRKRTDTEYQARIWERRYSVEKEIGELLSESAALRAWTHFFARLSDTEAKALRAWREAVKAIRKGTGQSGKIERLRREARQHMDKCRQAVPVWIMPRHVLAEMLNPAPDRYDIAIVDEASQLGIESLFLFYIAKKLVVVGDDQQISPYGIGIPVSAIENLQHRYLQPDIPYQVALWPQSSLYANAKIRFGQSVVLREHFRCMPEIIQFSNDLCYASNGTPLDPIRAYTTDRLRPLVVRHVEDGFRTGSPEHAINEPEADAIVSQIVACVGNSSYRGRTMGVISLQGEAQAKLIARKLLDVLAPEVIEERRLICGDAYAFQGDERHVIFLSMVAAPNERIGTLSDDSARQRFNVASSRARDQLWLFHSATLDVLSPRCLRHRLLSYMLAPERHPVGSAGQHFDSQFEKDVCKIIEEKGFHVRTQVCVGDPTNHRYRIDLVVEGMQGRLAVECDGDEWHGPERYEQDMARQRDLERAGWTFVRIRGGDFYRDPVRSMEPLWKELERLGIRASSEDEFSPPPPSPVEPVKRDQRTVDFDRNSAGPDTKNDVGGRGPTQDHRRDSVEPEPDLFRPGSNNGEEPESDRPKATRALLAEYISYQGFAGPDPRTAKKEAVTEGLLRVIKVEGPMIAKRAYDIYLRGCGIRRLGPELKSAMNKALMSAIRDGRIVFENELGSSGLIFSTVRLAGTPRVRSRLRGPRSFDEIPAAEFCHVAKVIADQGELAVGSDEYLRAILEAFDLKRLTAQVGTTLLEILERCEADEPPGHSSRTLL
ncbi:MAG TPA: AAA domain-containing protein [Alphaproteobacteria bacterium]|nr:AAA domain-containing protein [Alphaproteobacteria bacterium]